MFVEYSVDLTVCNRKLTFANQKLIMRYIVVLPEKKEKRWLKRIECSMIIGIA